MAFQQPGFTITRVAGEDLSNSQFRPVKLSKVVATRGQLLKCEGHDDDECIGVLQNKPKAGRAANVMCAGVSKLHTSGAFIAGDDLVPAVDGVVKNAAASGDNAMIVAIALEDAANDTIISGLLRGYVRQTE